MPGICRVSDLCSGHEGFPPRSPLTGSPDVTVNGIPVVRVGDPWSIHTRIIPPFDFHPGTQLLGSTTVTCNGLSVAREGDLLDCGSRVLFGSPDVSCGG